MCGFVLHELRERHRIERGFREFRTHVAAKQLEREEAVERVRLRSCALIQGQHTFGAIGPHVAAGCPKSRRSIGPRHFRRINDNFEMLRGAVEICNAIGGKTRSPVALLRRNARFRQNAIADGKGLLILQLREIGGRNIGTQPIQIGRGESSFRHRSLPQGLGGFRTLFALHSAQLRREAFRGGSLRNGIVEGGRFVADAPPVRTNGCGNGVFVDLLPAGSVLKQGCKVPFPQPTACTAVMQLVTLEQLVSLKLDSWSNSPARRLRDKADVTELILRRRLPRNLAVAAPVRNEYLEIWDALQAER